METQGRPRNKSLKFLPNAEKYTWEQVFEKASKNDPEQSPIGDPKLIICLSVRWCGRVCRSIALFYSVRRVRVSIAMGNENVDRGTHHFHSDFNKIPPGLPGGSPRNLRTTSGGLQGVPMDVLGIPKDALRLLGDALATPWDNPGLPRACQGTPQDVVCTPNVPLKLSRATLEHFFHVPDCLRMYC